MFGCVLARVIYNYIIIYLIQPNSVQKLCFFRIYFPVNNKFGPRVLLVITKIMQMDRKIWLHSLWKFSFKVSWNVHPVNSGIKISSCHSSLSSHLRYTQGVISHGTHNRWKMLLFRVAIVMKLSSGAHFFFFPWLTIDSYHEWFQ